MIRNLDNIFDKELLQVAVPEHITSNLNDKFPLRSYQIEAFKRFDYFYHHFRRPNEPNQLLFHMATGSGKTLIMAGLILDLYHKGYRNFLFFVHSTSILEKTKENFLKSHAAKYLFNQNIIIKYQHIAISEVVNFDIAHPQQINIHFTTIQGLHSKLNQPSENNLTFQDFENQKVVLISDEAHHINAETKKGKKTKLERLEIQSWEQTVNYILHKNPENILLEFTATIDLSHPEIAKKYAPRLLMDYSLKQFRKEGYSKDIKVVQSDLDPWSRSLQAMLISLYRSWIGNSINLKIKPVILFKSKTIKSSELFFDEFHERLNLLSVSDLYFIFNQSDIPVINQMKKFINAKKISYDTIVAQLKSQFAIKNCLVVNSKNDTVEKQLILNSLENEDNPVRAVFAVDKLNEGWDVLNLFNIVKLYDSGKPGKNINKTTISEAQLIGRGARYFPFRTEKYTEQFQRKFDEDPTNSLRILEELYYHASHNPAYINELDRAMIHIGLKAKLIDVEIQTNPSFYNSSYADSLNIYLNEIQEVAKNVSLKDMIGDETLNPFHPTLDLGGDFPINTSHFSKQLIKKAFMKHPFYRFANLKKYFPDLMSSSQFINSKNYLGGLNFMYAFCQETFNVLPPPLKLNYLMQILENVAQIISKYEFKSGSKIFSSKILNQLLQPFQQVKIVKLEMNHQSNEIISGEEVKKLQNSMQHHGIMPIFIEDKLEKLPYDFQNNLIPFIENYNKNYNIFLLRNYTQLNVYDFDTGKNIQPDYVLFLNPKIKKNQGYQIFVHLNANSATTAFLQQLNQMKLVMDNRVNVMGLDYQSPQSLQNLRTLLD